MRASALCLAGALVACSLPALAQEGPQVVIVAPPPLVRAGPAEGSTPSESDLAFAARGAKSFAPLVAAIIDRMDNTLLDYPATRFKDVSFGYRNGKQIVCGFYNGKNRMGAYSGWAVFYAFTGDEPRIVLLRPDEAAPYTHTYHCGAATAWVPGDWSSLFTYRAP
ncbi:MAG: hypothetical protein WAW13_00640 [Minisyncoccia bacterium]